MSADVNATEMAEAGDGARAEVTSTGSLPPMGPLGFLRWCWRQLTSMRTALILLFLLAIASVPGSLLPQRGTDPIRVNDWLKGNPTWGPVLDRFGFFNVYGSAWFAAIYLLLFISLVGCVLPRMRQHARALRAKPPRAPRHLERLEVARTWPESVDTASAYAIDESTRWLRKRRWRVETGSDDAGPWVAAEKGFLKETGNLVFHASLLLLLVAVGLGSVFGWKGNVIVVEGRGFSDTLTQFDVWGGGRLVDPASLPPFSFTLEDFRVDFERGAAQRGAPRLFEADLAYTRSPDAPVERRTIEVNEPLDIDGVKVFLVGHGYAPHVVVRDALGEIVYDGSVAFLPQDGMFTSTGVIKVPDGTPQLGFRGVFAPTAEVDDVRGPHSTFPGPDNPVMFLSAWTGDLGLDDGVPQSIYTLDTSKLNQIGLQAMQPGDVWVLPENLGAVEFTGFDRWASFQIARDPGKEFALVAAMLAIAGVALTLFIRRRRVWVRVVTGSDGRRVVAVGGLAKGEVGGLAEEVDELARAAGWTAEDGAGSDTAGTGKGERT